MKCKYCKTQIGLVEWFGLGGKCSYCDNKKDEIKREKRNIKSKIRERDSNKYWAKHDALSGRDD